MNHPLTDELCCQVWQDNKDNWLMWQEPCPPIRRTMRAAADWQLEQVIEWLRNNLGEGRHIDTDDVLPGIDAENVVIDLKQAMRPQEDN